VSQLTRPALFAGASNVRDLGGMPLVGGGETRHHRLVRMDSPHALTDEGLAAVVEYGVATVVDLRTEGEQRELPSRLLEMAAIRHVNAPIFTDQRPPEHLRTSADVYCWWFEDCRPGLRDALVAIADAPAAPVLIHCHAGKDRTGVIVALILRLAGVDPELIADDYALSAVMLREMLEQDRQHMLARGEDPERVERILSARPESILEALSRIETEHGDVATVMRMLELDETQVERLRTLLVADSWP
jgi:protein-tyrosine phosphatase